MRLKKIALLLIVLILFSTVIYSENSFNNDKNNNNKKFNLNFQLLGNGFGAGINACMFLKNKLLFGVGISYDPLILVVGYDGHVYLNYYLFNTQLNMYYNINIGFFYGMSSLFNKTYYTNWFFVDNKIGIEYSFKHVFIDLDFGIRYNFIKENDFNTNLIYWGGLSIGYRF